MCRTPTTGACGPFTVPNLRGPHRSRPPPASPTPRVRSPSPALARLRPPSLPFPGLSLLAPSVPPVCLPDRPPLPLSPPPPARPPPSQVGRGESGRPSFNETGGGGERLAPSSKLSLWEAMGHPLSAQAACEMPPIQAPRPGDGGGWSPSPGDDPGVMGPMLAFIPPYSFGAA